MHADFRISLYRLLALASTISLVQAFYIPGMLYLVLIIDLEM